MNGKFHRTHLSGVKEVREVTSFIIASNAAIVSLQLLSVLFLHL